MAANEKTWIYITQKYFGKAWVENETKVMQQMTEQQKKLPISVEDAKAQVLRLKSTSQSTVKKGQNLEK